MKQHGRPWVVFLPVFVTLALAAAVGTAVIVQNQEQSDRVAEADRVAERFLSQVGTFHSSVVDAINESGYGDPGDLVDVLDAAISRPPTLGEAPADGGERSATYVGAQQTQKDFLKPYQQVRRDLHRADIALDFIRACRGALALKVSEYVGFAPLADSRTIRGKLIPAFVQAREAFEAVRVPRGQEELAAQVTGALQYVIDQSTVLADRIEASHSYAFSYAEQFQTASAAVDDFATRVKGDVVEALNALNDAG